MVPSTSSTGSVLRRPGPLVRPLSRSARIWTAMVPISSAGWRMVVIPDAWAVRSRPSKPTTDIPLGTWRPRLSAHAINSDARTLFTATTAVGRWGSTSATLMDPRSAADMGENANHKCCGRNTMLNSFKASRNPTRRAATLLVVTLSVVRKARLRCPSRIRWLVAMYAPTR